ncbi:hypothetical protein JCM31271_19570 [Halorubrum trueperi]
MLAEQVQHDGDAVRVARPDVIQRLRDALARDEPPRDRRDHTGSGGAIDFIVFGPATQVSSRTLGPDPNPRPRPEPSAAMWTAAA